MKKSIYFIINPISGTGKKAQLPKLIDTYLDKTLFDYKIIYSEYCKHAKEIAAQAAHDGVDIVCAVGGDGSVHEVGTALIGTKTALAILPVGSGNGLARHLKIPLKIDKAIQCINEQNKLLMDTGLVNDKPFLGIGGYGFDALIAEKFNKSGKRGMWNYIKLIAREFYSFKPISIRIELPNFKRELPVVLCTLANASEFGNGFCISPTSSVTDGKLELCLLKPFKFWKAPMIAYHYFKKTSYKSQFTEVISLEKARITLNQRMGHYDGEPFEVRKELNIQVVPKSLHVLTGMKSSN
jgi:YegS/Rv2252/BmrU family lipid kinase